MPSRNFPFIAGLRALLMSIFLTAAPLCATYAANLFERETQPQACARLMTRPTQRPARPFDYSRPTIVLVDGYSSGRFMPAAFRDAGLQVVHVHANGTVGKVFEGSFWPESYDYDISYDGNLAMLQERLKHINVIGVLPGTDTGVFLADELSQALSVTNPQIFTNGVDRARKDKSLMVHRLGEFGLDRIRQIKTADPEIAVQWAKSLKLFEAAPGMAVIKPILSAGGDGIYFPKSADEVRSAFKKLIGEKDELGHTNQQILIQEYLAGTEYVLNSTVFDGHVVYTEIWRYQKRFTTDGHMIYDIDVLLPYEGEVQAMLREYDRKVIHALGIRYGNCHSEIKMVPGRGPVLVEMNNRPMGSGQPLLASFAVGGGESSQFLIGRSQVELTALAVAQKAQFLKEPESYRIRKNAVVFSPANLYGKNMKLNPAARKIFSDLPGFFQQSLHFEPGTVVKPTIDIFTNLGEIWFLHEDMNVIMTSIETLHKMEIDGTLFGPE